MVEASMGEAAEGEGINLAMAQPMILKHPVMHRQAKILSVPPLLRMFAQRESPMYQPQQQQEGAAARLPGTATACG